MKRFMCLFLAVLSYNVLNAKEEKGYQTAALPQGIRFDPTPFFDKNLKDILAPNVQVLDFNSIASKMPIDAYSISLDCMEGPSFFHIGNYCNARIETRIGCAGTGCINNPEIGEQVVFFFSGTCCYKFHSTSWTLEILNGVPYIVHSYDTYKVYSNDKKQFVIGN